MVRLCALASAFSILALFVCAPLQADDLLETFSTYDTAAVEPPAPAESQEESLPPVAEDSIYSLSDPGCCNQPAGPCCTECDSGFEVRFVPYGWLFAVKGNTTVRGLTAPVNVSIRDTLDILEHDVHFIFSGKLEVENNECGLIVNGFYMNAGFENTLPRLNFDSNFKMAIVDIAATYNLASDAECFPIPYVSRFDVLAGVRYWQLDGGLTVTGPRGNSRSRSGEREWVDPIVGGRIIVPLSEGTEAQLRGDVGGFDWGTASEFTWNLEALVSMQCSERVSLRGGYRVLDVDNQQDSGGNRFGFDVQFRGPVAELAIEF